MEILYPYLRVPALGYLFNEDPDILTYLEGVFYLTKARKIATAVC